MLIDQLRDDQVIIANARHALRTALDNRDRTIQELREIKVPINTIGRITNLSPQRIAVIQAKNLDATSSPDLDGTVGR